jgi:rhodanese-related sulfurtransferase
MDMEFVVENWPLFLALVVIIALIIFEPIRRRMSGIEEITVIQLTRLLNDEEAVLVDVSESKDFKLGHLPKAINIPLSKLAGDLKQIEKHKSRSVVAFCRSGNRSIRGAGILRKNGFEKVLPSRVEYSPGRKKTSRLKGAEAKVQFKELS